MGSFLSAFRFWGKNPRNLVRKMGEKQLSACRPGGCLRFKLLIFLSLRNIGWPPRCNVQRFYGISRLVCKPFASCWLGAVYSGTAAVHAFAVQAESIDVEWLDATDSRTARILAFEGIGEGGQRSCPGRGDQGRRELGTGTRDVGTRDVRTRDVGTRRGFSME